MPAHITPAGPWSLSLELPLPELSAVAMAAHGVRYRFDRLGVLGNAVCLLPADDVPLLALRSSILEAVGEPDALDPSWKPHLTICREASEPAIEEVRHSIQAALPLDCEVDSLCIARLSAPDRVEITAL